MYLTNLRSGEKMADVNLNILYDELKSVKKRLAYLEDVLIPEEELSEKELRELEELRKEAVEEHKKGQTIKLEDI